MNNPTPTLKDIFGWPDKELTPDQWSELEASDRMKDLRTALERQGIAGHWSAAKAEILEKTEELLNVELSDVLTRAWSKVRELQGYRDSEKYPPENSYLVPLAKHTIRSVHKPHLEIRVNRKTIGRVEIEIEIEIEIRSMMLTIQGGKIWKIATGECRGEGSLYCEGILLAQEESKSLRLPGTIELAEGLEI